VYIQNQQARAHYIILITQLREIFTFLALLLLLQTTEY